MKYSFFLILVLVVICSKAAEETLQTISDKKNEKRGIYGFGYGYPGLHGYLEDYRGYHGYSPAYYGGYGYHGLGFGHGYHGGYLGYNGLGHF